MRHAVSGVKQASLILGALLCFSLASGASAEAAVWKVEKDDKRIYLGGTIHLLTENDFPLPEEYDQAYSVADRIYFETDLDAASTPAFGAAATKAMTYSDGRTLRSVLSPEVYQQLTQYLASKGIPGAVFDSFTAAGVSLTITVIELQALGYTSTGVDKYYFDLAKQDAKTLGFFETPEDQLAFISELGEGIEDELVSHTLSDMARLSDMFEEMKRYWITGDVDGLDKVLARDMRDNFPKAYDSILVRRNNNWMLDIEPMFADDDEVEFVLVGAAHMAGPDGLLALLTNKGYKVTKL